RFGEAFFDTQSQSFNLTAGELELNDQDKSKSTGTLYPAAQLILDKEGKLQLDLNQNPWRLSDLIDWKGTAGVNWCAPGLCLLLVSTLRDGHQRPPVVGGANDTS